MGWDKPSRRSLPVSGSSEGGTRRWRAEPRFNSLYLKSQEQKDHWLGRKFKCPLSPIRFQCFQSLNSPLSLIYQKELLMRTLAHWDRNPSCHQELDHSGNVETRRSLSKKIDYSLVYCDTLVMKLWARNTELEIRFYLPGGSKGTSWKSRP